MASRSFEIKDVKGRTLCGTTYAAGASTGRCLQIDFLADSYVGLNEDMVRDLIVDLQRWLGEK